MSPTKASREEPKTYREVSFVDGLFNLSRGGGLRMWRLLFCNRTSQNIAHVLVTFISMIFEGGTY
jgi:hypothetical protein